MIAWLRKNKLVIAILIAGFILRSFWYRELFYYSHDQDLLGWIIRDILENRHLRLIGQETSQLGVFIGPLYYYLMIPFYLITNMDPIGGVFASILIGTITVFSFYWVLRKIFDKRTGLIGGMIYAVSYLTVMTDREVNPTTLVMLWSVWFLYALWALLNGKQKSGFIITGILVGSIWHLNLALALLLPLVPLTLYMSRKKLNFKFLLYGLIPAIFLSLPLVVFEMRHNFSQTASVINSLSTKKEIAFVETTGIGKLDRVLQLVTKNINRLFVGEYNFIPNNLLFVALILAFTFLVYKKKISKQVGVIFFFWLTFFVAFFTFNPINVSEYYLNGMNVIWIAIAAFALSHIAISKKLKFTANFFIILILVVNVYRFFSQPINRSGYIERRQLVEFIKKDSELHNYPCVSVSYITNPGYELGYRYLYYLEEMHVNQPSSLSPVYTVVFPHSKVDRIDKSFGALGLILPEYEKYSTDSVTISCGGQNANLTDSMFGYVE